MPAENMRIKEAVCIHTRKVYDSCKDRDCVENLRVFPTRGSQAIIDRAINVKCRKVELLWVYIDVEPVSFNRGFYTVDVSISTRLQAMHSVVLVTRRNSADLQHSTRVISLVVKAMPESSAPSWFRAKMTKGSLLAPICPSVS